MTKGKSAEKYKGMSKEAKRRDVISDNLSEIEQFSCPLCGWSRVIETRKGRIRFDKVDLQNGEVFQIRYAGGRGSGFYKDPTKSRSLIDIKNDPELKDLISQIKNKCKEILKVLR